MEPKRLTDERMTQIREWMAKREGDSNLSYDEGVILLLLGHIAALSAVPEDVARDEHVVREALEDGYRKTGVPLDVEPALSRLATAAARVPGLEARVHKLDAESGVRLSRLKRAESERNAARQEAALLRADADAALLKLDRALAERDAEVRDMERTDYKAPPVTEDMSTPPTSPDAPRARIAPTPKPEVPALVCGHTTCSRGMLAVCKRPPHTDDVPHRWEEQPGTVADPEVPALAVDVGRCEGCAGPSTCSDAEGVPLCDQCAEVLRESDSQPESAAPEVVWEGAGVAVNADGSYSQRPGFHPHEVVDTLARALAEAKRENARLRKEMDVPPGFRLWDRCNDALQREARKAAEAMRERAAHILVGYYAQCTQPRCNACDVARAAEADIRALPMESK